MEKGLNEFDEGRAWTKRRGDVITIGVTLAGLDAVGEIEEIALPEEGDVVEEGDVLVTLDGSVGTFELLAPADGTVLEVNITRRDAEKLVADPLDEGWVLKLQVDD